MDSVPYLRLKLHDRSYSGIVKKEINKLAKTLEFTSYRLAEIDIIIAEMVSNLNKHSVEGEILANVQEGYLEILSIDHGPGMANLRDMLSDGRSTTKTLGQGLGAIKRLSDEFDIYSIPGWGTIVLSRIYTGKFAPAQTEEPVSINALLAAKPGETECGDGWSLIKKRSLYKLIALDGLGHGPEAARAVRTTIKEFHALIEDDPAETIKVLHRRVRGTRGAVGMVFHINKASGMIAFAGLGNIGARFVSAERSKNCISYNGIIGYAIPNSLHSNSITWRPNETLIIHSDGLKTRWDLSHLPNILNQDGSILAAALYKDFSRGNDDLLIIVLKKKK